MVARPFSDELIASFSLWNEASNDAAKAREILTVLDGDRRVFRGPEFSMARTKCNQMLESEKLYHKALSVRTSMESPDRLTRMVEGFLQILQGYLRRSDFELRFWPGISEAFRSVKPIFQFNGDVYHATFTFKDSEYHDLNRYLTLSVCVGSETVYVNGNSMAISDSHIQVSTPQEAFDIFLDQSPGRVIHNP